MLILVIGIILYPKKDTFIDKFKFKIGCRGIELEVSAKEKNDPPDEDDRSNHK
ncbi:MAG: hypothetical protein ACRDDY_14890 [Clostridium sp.]